VLVSCLSRSYIPAEFTVEEVYMAEYPKVKKAFSRLSKDDSLRSTTIQLVTGALLSTGLFLSGNTPVQAKSIEAPTMSAPSIQGSAIVLGAGSGVTKQGNALLAQHYSHSSHGSHHSHASHHSHYSSR